MRKYPYIIAVSILFLVTGCKKLDLFPNDQPTSENFFSNRDELLLGVNACYADLVSVDARYVSESLLDHVTDIGFNRGGHEGYQSTGRGEGSSFTQAFRTNWVRAYRGIARCNNLIENMVRAKSNTDSVLYNRINAEARFLRAYYYHRLIELYGDVPLITAVINPGEEFVSRTAKDEVVNFILNELQEIAPALPLEYDSKDAGRVTRGAAHSLRARVALYNSRWNEAISSAQTVMSSNVYTLYPNYRNLFTYAGESSDEVILEYQFLLGFKIHGKPRNNQSRMNGGFSQPVPSQSMVDSYECTDGNTIDVSPLYDPATPFANRDPRLNATIVLPGTRFGNFQFETHRDSTTCLNYITGNRVANQDVTNPFATFSGYLWKKYLDDKDLVQMENSELNWILIRYAEVLLTYAEAKIESNQIDQSVLDAINRVRARAYGVDMSQTGSYPAISTTNQAELRKIIRRERKVELAYEGFRLFDIRRWRIAEKVMPGKLLGRPPRNFSVMGRPVFDEDGVPNYSAYESEMRVIETRSFNAQRDYLWAIPQTDININKNLTQNPGY